MSWIPGVVVAWVMVLIRTKRSGLILNFDSKSDGAIATNLVLHAYKLFYFNRSPLSQSPKLRGIVFLFEAAVAV